MVATPAGTTTHPNAVRLVDGDADESTGGDGDLVVETDEGTCLVGEAATAGDGWESLLGGDPALPRAARAAAVEAFLDAYADDPGEGVVRYVDRAGGTDLLASVLRELGYSATELDAGMAVCHAAFDPPATAVGIAVGEHRATATLAVSGVPVGTAAVERDEWYERPGDASAEGIAGEWLAMQYETLLGDLAAELGDAAPAVEGPVPVAVAGEAAPPEVDDRTADALAARFPFEVGAVTVADDPAGALARGALAAAEADDGVPVATPAYAHGATGDAVGADPGGAAEALGAATRDGVETVADAPTPRDGTDPGTGGDVTAAVASTQTELARLERRNAKTGRAISTLIDRVERAGVGAEAERIEALGEEVEAIQSRLPDEEGPIGGVPAGLDEDLDDLRESVERLEADLEAMETATADAGAVEDLESSLSSMDETVDQLESDTRKLQSLVADLDDDVSIEDLGSDEPDLRNDIEALDDRIADAMENVWEEVDELDSRLTDVSATVEDLPDLESDVRSTRDSVVDLDEEVSNLRETLGRLQNDVSNLDDRTASAEDVEAVRNRLESLSTDVDVLRREFDEEERVDPATVEEMGSNLDGIRKTLMSQAERLEDVENETSNLDNRIENVFQNTAKAEALSSLEAEVSRIRQTANQSEATANDAASRVDEMQNKVQNQRQELSTISTNIDNLAGNAVTRGEMESKVGNLEDRIDRLEGTLRGELEDLETADVEAVDEEEGAVGLAFGVMALGLIGVGIAGAVLAILTGPYILIALVLVVVSLLAGVIAWLAS